MVEREEREERKWKKSIGQNKLTFMSNKDSLASPTSHPNKNKNQLDYMARCPQDERMPL